MFEALRDELPDEWELFHGIDWLERDEKRGAKIGETDLVLCHPERGVLVLEVKGGGISCRSGKWFRDGKPMKDPLKQVRDNQGALKRMLQEAADWKVGNPFIVHALAFPTASKHKFQLGPGTPPEIIVDRIDLRENLVDAVDRVLAFHRGEDDSRDPPGRDGAAALHEILAPDATIRVPLAQQLEDEDDQLIHLTARQSIALKRMQRAKRMVITGCAGSGKTMLAAEQAQRLAAKDKRVLLVCFNKRLRDHLRDFYERPGLEIWNVHGLAIRAARKAAIELPDSDWTELGDEFWHEELSLKLIEAAAQLHPEFEYDALLIDEAQDLNEDWLEALRSLLAHPEEDPIWLFRDDNQNVYGTELGEPDGFHPYDLDTNCRNTQLIHKEVMKKYRGEIEPAVSGPVGRKPKLEYSDNQRETVAQVIEQLCGEEEIEPRDVVVLSSHGENAEVLSKGLPGRYQLTDEYPPADGKICFSSIRGFKGLESKVVILCELEDLPDDSMDNQLYVGVSRARTHCVVVVPPVSDT